MRRRTLLGTLGSVAASGIAGCTDSLSSQQSNPTSSRAATTDSFCKKGGKLVNDMRVKYGSLDGFDLIANKDEITRGDQITFRLVNITESEKLSGVKSKYSIHWKSEEGWRNIFYPSPESDQQSAYNDLGVKHRPDEGFKWEVVFSPDGLAHDIADGVGSLSVCTPLQLGTYRFVYWGVNTKQERENEEGNEFSLGTRFNLTDKQ